MDAQEPWYGQGKGRDTWLLSQYKIICMKYELNTIFQSNFFFCHGTKQGSGGLWLCPLQLLSWGEILAALAIVKDREARDRGGSERRLCTNQYSVSLFYSFVVLYWSILDKRHRSDNICGVLDEEQAIIMTVMLVDLEYRCRLLNSMKLI